MELAPFANFLQQRKQSASNGFGVIRTIEKSIRIQRSRVKWGKDLRSLMRRHLKKLKKALMISVRSKVVRKGLISQKCKVGSWDRASERSR